MAKASDFLSSISSSYSLVKTTCETMLDLRDTQKDNEHAKEINILLREVFNMNQQAIELSNLYAESEKCCSSLQRKLDDLMNKRNELAKYQLIEVAAGVFVLGNEVTIKGNQTIRYICPDCAENDKVQSLYRRTQGHREYFECHGCNSEIEIAPHRSMYVFQNNKL
ncbi:hypothetical protein GDQ58_06940 [Salmonella enterica subsp. diarizonae]|uniref:hypothetical protein n=1 Tax=Salmonella sp. NW603 TaxID=2948131 RepID=UPI0012CB4913|nr:hypothetical protein [Salmonella enterica subsp. diarizonae]HAD5966793.1 hypothetical protein [Salmonella enterica subsp. enterica serovar Typhimurium]HBM0785017.1 hypothetical protein [Salmonella enterica]